MKVPDQDFDWQARFSRELQRAEAARQLGNEGQARVCARRAAGLAAAEYLRRHSLNPPGASAYDHLRRLASLPDLPANAGELAGRFLIRVDTNHALPPGVDLLADARAIIQVLQLT